MKEPVSDNLAQMMDESDRVSATEVKLNLKTIPRVKPDISNTDEQPKSMVEKVRELVANPRKFKSYTEEMLLYLVDPSQN